MLVFSEYQSKTIDLGLDFYGYEDCPANYSFGPAIRDNFVLHYITKGKGRLEYRNKSNQLQAGDLFLLKPNELTFYQADQEEPWSYYWLGISGTKAKDYFQLASIYEPGFLKKTNYRDTQALADFIRKMIEEAERTQPSPLKHLRIISQLHDLLYRLGELAPNQQRKEISSTQQLYLDTKHIIETRYPIENLNIQAMADELNVHRSYLSTTFKQFHDLSPKEYLLYIRMQRAKQLLENTDEPIKFIAYSVGFSDPLYFSKAFKNYFHCSPSKIKQKNIY